MTRPTTPARVPSGTSSHVDQDQGYQALSYIMAGPLFYGGLGWLGDRYFHTGFLLPAGLGVGIILSLYLVVKRFGGHEDAPATNAAEGTPSHGEESQ